MAELELSSLKRWKGKQDEMTGAYWRKTKEARKQAIKNFKEQKFLKKLEKQRAEQQKTEKDQEEKKEQKERLPTVSVALPGSVLDNAQSPDLRTYLAGQIARACTVFCVDEIVVFDEQGEDAKQIVFVYYCGLDEDQTTFFEQLVQKTRTVEGEFQGIGKKGHASVQLARILQYLECPQYLRKSFFPKHRDLQFAGLLNPLDSPHHMRIDEASEYREGVVVDKPSKPNKGSFVNCGMRKDVQIDRCLRAGLRVTVQLHKNKHPESKRFKGTVVAPHVPRMESGLYWGYTVRLASCLSAVFTECPFEDGYDLTIGTSERGSNTDGTTLPSFRFPDLITDEDKKGKTKSLKLDPPLRSTMADLVSDIYLAAQYRHMLVVFGGLKGLEASVDADENLKLTEPSVLFHHYLNTCPGQGSRTIRTEEAILITLSALRPKIDSALRRADSS